MSRDAKIRATAGALHPKAIDLAARRQRSVRDNDFHVQPDVAAGALAFSSAGSDRLAPLLLRLKYARIRTRASFETAQELLLHRYGGMSRPPSLVMGAVAMAALLEWVHDTCPKCRERREATIQPTRCECIERQETRRTRASREDAWGTRMVCVGSPAPGCGKCGGSGRIFGGKERERGIRCLTCNSTGRITFDPRKRGRAVSEIVAAAQLAVGDKVTGFPQKRFGNAWQSKYWRFIDVLRLIDKMEVGVLAFGFKEIHTAPIETDPIEEPVEGSE